MKASSVSVVVCVGLFATVPAACSWTKFDDLADNTWVHAQETPDSDQSDYAVALVPEVTGEPGTLAVLSAQPPNISTLSFDATGATNETDSTELGNSSISEISLHPVFIGDGTGNAALIERSTDGPLIAVYGSAGAYVESPPLASTNPADAAIFAGSALFVTAAGAMPTATVANAFLIGQTVANCVLVDDNGGSGSPLAAAAMTTDGTTAWVYTRAGNVVGYALSDLAAGCTDTTQSPAPIAPTIGPIATTTPAANGGAIALVGNYAIAVAYDSPTTSSGAVSVIDLNALAPVGTPMPAPNVEAAAFGTFGGMPTLALGFPTRVVGTTEGVGEVELHAVDTAAGTVNATVVETLSIPEADSDLLFGRALTAMTYNNQSILVVGANNVVYAYYKTTLYGDTREK